MDDSFDKDGVVDGVWDLALPCFLYAFVHLLELCLRIGPKDVVDLVEVLYESFAWLCHGFRDLRVCIRVRHVPPRARQVNDIEEFCSGIHELFIIDDTTMRVDLVYFCQGHRIWNRIREVFCLDDDLGAISALQIDHFRDSLGSTSTVNCIVVLFVFFFHSCQLDSDVLN